MNLLEYITSAQTLKGEYLEVSSLLSRGQNAVITGLSQPYKLLFASSVSQKVVYVCDDSVDARNICQTFKQYGKKAFLLLERFDNLVYKKAEVGAYTGERIRALCALTSGDFDVLVTTVECLLGQFPQKSVYLDGIITLIKGGKFDYEDILSRLTYIGYERVDEVQGKGEFSLHGEVLDLFLPTEAFPLRIITFDDEIESMKYYSPDNIYQTNEVEAVTVYPLSDITFTEDEFNSAMSLFAKEIRKTVVNERLKEIYDELSMNIGELHRGEGLWFLAPFASNMTDFSSLLPENAVLFFDECALLGDKIRVLNNENKARIKTLCASGETTAAHSKCILNLNYFTDIISPFPKIATMPVNSVNPLFSVYKIFNMKTDVCPDYFSDRERLISDLDSAFVTKRTVLVACGDIRRAKLYGDALLRDMVPNKITSSLDDVLSAGYGVFVTDLDIGKGFNVPSAKLYVIGKENILRASNTDTKSEGKRKRAPFVVPNVGDYIVHEVHGIGICLGVKRLKVIDGEKDFVAVSYKGNDMLYVPVESMDRLSRYSGSDAKPTVNKLGGAEFAKVKLSVRNKIKEMAFDLLELYAKRASVKGIKYPYDNDLQLEFEYLFPYELTTDQVTAVREIKNDLESGKVMDRLLCGDVGYGKTEVALRAAFKVVNAGKQVAFLAPTTILAMQHYNNLKERFEHFGIKTAVICRLQNKEQVKTALKELEEGKVEVIVGTHRLLSKDVKFKDLGLLVLDEEQRFGVEHKEKLKTIKNSVNVLSLSATPIPRTLSMALTGVRDISLLETPPAQRLPVQTFVTEYREPLIADALNRELARGGQVFLLYNRVETIFAFAERIAYLVPEAKISVAHGQMTDYELEKNVSDFFSKNTNVLICTTIIENGIDLPDANTLIVIDSDRLGLSELYQLRGRVGRSNRLAYAYFTYNKEKSLSEDAIKRLNAIMEYTDFGSGFKIAMRDLEIRGAGNVLGREQHGNIVKVGYDMYCEMLEEEIEKLSGAQNVESEKECEMLVDIDAYVTDEYAQVAGGKMLVYRRVSEIRTEGDMEELRKELLDKTGSVPYTLENLMLVALCKSKAASMGIKKVIVNKRDFKVVLTGPEALSNGGLVSTVSTYGSTCYLEGGNDLSVIFRSAFNNVRDRLDFLLSFLTECEENAKNGK